MTTLDPAQQLADWLQARSPGALLTEPPPELDREVVEAIYALRPDRAPAARVGLDEILEAVQAGPFQGNLDEEDAPEADAADAPTFREDPTLPPVPRLLTAPSSIADAPDPPSMQFEEGVGPTFDSTAFNKALEAHGSSAVVEGIETAQASALERWLEARAHGQPPEAVGEEVVEAVFALRPDLAPAPRFDLDDVLSSVQDGPFAQGAEVVSLAPGAEHGIAPVGVDEGEDDPTILPAEDARPRAGEAAPMGGVVSLDDVRRKRGLAWWAAPGLGVALAAAAAVTFVVIPSMQGGLAPSEEMAAADGPAPPASLGRKGSLDDQIAAGSTTATTEELSEALADQPKRARQVGTASVAGAEAADTGSMAFAARPSAASMPAGGEGSAASNTASSIEDLESLGYLSGEATGPATKSSASAGDGMAEGQGSGGLLGSEAQDPAPSADDDWSGELALRGGGYRDEADEAPGDLAERSMEEQEAIELATATRKDRSASPAQPSSGPAEARSYEAAEAEDEADLDGSDYDYATTTNTGSLSNTGGMGNTGDWNTGAPPRSTQELRIEAVTSSASPSRAQLTSQHPELAEYDRAAADALANGDSNGAVKALEPLMKHSDADVVMDTAFAIADLLRSNGRNDLALAYVARGLGTAGGSTSQRSRLLALRGVLLESRGDESGARRYYQESLDAIESGY